MTRLLPLFYVLFLSPLSRTVTINSRMSPGLPPPAPHPMLILKNWRKPQSLLSLFTHPFFPFPASF